MRSMSRRVVSAVKESAIAPVSALSAAPADSAPVSQQADTYLTKLVKYIPAEIIAVYIFISGILKSLEASAALQWVAFALLLVLTPLYMWRVTQDKTKPPAWAQIIIASFSFAVWVFAVGGPFVTLPWYNTLYGSLLVAVYTLVVPMISN